ncbi:MAG: hypothetical protein C0591_07335 [Marinilabiliales bacterium]|nr:MAG: hypothetical protein C0591_07335 [Marinilabiliales bacterium]
MRIITTFVTLLMLGFLFFSCKGTKKTTEANQIVKPASDKISLYTLPSDSLKTDYFNIDSIAMKDQTLFVFITYSGGCGDVKFEMFYKPQFLTVMPHRNSLLLKLTDDDPCRELIQKKLTYDLSIFNAEAQSGGVVFNLDKYEFMYTISEE